MAIQHSRADSSPAAAPGEKIDSQLALRIFRLLVEIREAEQRAYDLFLQNLVKGTSHLSLGQEAVAAGCGAAMRPGDLSFCTYRGHAHTLAPGQFEDLNGNRIVHNTIAKNNLNGDSLDSPASPADPATTGVPMPMTGGIIARP